MLVPSTSRVLILDDEPSVGISIARMVEYLGIECASVSDSNTFFEVVRAWNPTHIVLDLVMPVMDGVEVLQQLGQLGCRAKITISSGVGSRVLNAAKISAVEHGLQIAGALPKPFSLGALEEFLCVSEDALAHTERNPSAARTEADITRTDIETGIRNREFEMVYQPKIDCIKRKLIGFESLIRWNHPLKGLIMPDRFIPLSENLGLMGPITNLVVDQVFTWYLDSAPAEELSLSINISAMTLAERDFANWLEESCKQRAIQPTCIILEITETAALNDPLLTLDMFTRLRMKGFQVSIDDFGIGNSSLALLARLPFSEVKVDKRFAMTAVTSRESMAIIKSTVDLGHSLGLTVVAEGVEDGETLDFLTEIGCDQAQGYYIARPLSASRIPDWLANSPAKLKASTL